MNVASVLSCTFVIVMSLSASVFASASADVNADVNEKANAKVVEKSNVEPNQNALTLEKITDQIELKPFLRGAFRQERTLKGFNRTLVSSGQYYFWKDHGLYWEVQKPFFRATTFGNDLTISWSSPGEVSSSTAPKLIQKQISKVLIAVLGADIETLQRYFVATAHYNPVADGGEEGDKRGVTDNGEAGERDEASAKKLTWSMQLEPKDFATRKALKQLDLIGGTSIHEIRVTSSNGGITHIQFSGPNMLEQPLKKQCELYYPQTTEEMCQ